MIKTFKGKVADSEQDKIYLAGGDSSKGYRIVKFQAIAIDSEEGVESALKVYSVSQSSIDNAIDFTDETLLAAMIYNDSESNAYAPAPVVIFDRMVFNQDIYITLKGSAGVITPFLNYYIELEEVTMSDAEAANVNFVAALTHT